MMRSLALATALIFAPLCLSLPIPAAPSPLDQERDAAEAPAPEDATPRLARFQDGKAKEKLAGADEYRSIQSGVSWLVENQAPDGSWSVEGGAGAPSVGASSLALLALLGDGHTTRHGDHRDAVGRAVEWLVAQQDAETGEVGKDRLQDHALATLALCEVRRFDSQVAAEHEAFQAALRAARFLLAADVWSKPEDPVELAWCVAAALEAKSAGAEVDQGKLDGVREWIQSTVEKTGKVPVGGTPEVKERGTAVLLLPRLLLGDDPKRGRYLERQANRLCRAKAKPTWEQDDLEYWYWATNALERLGGENWKLWKPAMTEVLQQNRAKDRTPQGSWPAVGFDPARGVVRSTAMATLMFEAPYRFALVVKPIEFPKDGFNDVIGIGGGAGGKFGGRFGGRRNRRVTGGEGTELALKNALAWLVENQAPDGSWSASDTEYPVGTTGLSLLALIGDGSTTRLARTIHEHAPQTSQPAGFAGLSAPAGTLRTPASSTT